MNAPHPSDSINAITLSALKGEPLADERVRETVIAAARAIAERIGVEIVDIETTDSSITTALKCRRLEAWGFAAELRRLTNAWHESKYGATLWGEAREADNDGV